MLNRTIADNSFYDNVDCVKIEVGGSPHHQDLGMFERMRQTLFGAGHEGEGAANNTEQMLMNTQEDEQNSETESVENATAQLLSESIMNGQPEKPLSVLDELDKYWQEHDAMSVKSEQHFGIMSRPQQTENMI